MFDLLLRPDRTKMLLARAKSLQGSVVTYVIRFGGYVKIGRTRNLQQRIERIPCEEIVAVYPGDIERELHEFFGWERVYTIGNHFEWFHDGPALRDYLHQLEVRREGHHI